MLHITFANRGETLFDALLDGRAATPASPFAAEQIVVPSAALRRKLAQAIADRDGICSNVEFSFLAQWLWRQIAHLVPAVAAASPFAPPVLAWRIDRIFDDAAFLRDQPRLEAYLREADPVMRHDLALRVAALLEQYLSYRQDWLADWSAGRAARIGGADAASRQDEQWQAALWRRIAGELGMAREHPAAQFLRSIAETEGEALRHAGLPATAHLFCLPALPPLYLDILRQLGRWIDLRLYVLNPCREYWYEIVDPRRLGYLAVAGTADYHESGNRLLAAWGRQTQAHIDLLLEQADEAVIDDARFAPAAGETLLARLQNGILDLREPAPAGIVLADDDRSIEVHVCHSLTRELEALQDRLLALFAGDAPPQPGDILVVTPDIEATAPLIDAVFGNAPRARFIPYAITGRGRGSVNAAAQALLALLALAASRFPASGVFSLLQQDIVGRRFGLVGDDLSRVHDWLRDAAVCWGIDGRHRAQFHLPDIDRHSFADGLHRLFLGYALPAGIDAPWHGRAPAGDAEGAPALALGALWRFAEALRQLHDALIRPKPAQGWLDALDGILDDFLAPAADEIEDLRELRASLRELHDNMRLGGAAAAIPLEVVQAALQALLDDPGRGGVATGTLTFASMGSLRGLPFRFIAAIGLNDGAFPGTARPAEFDLMARDPRRGDRQRRDDERNLFLDLLLAAREALYLSYSGRSIRDNAALPPSVLVAELLDALVAAVAGDAGAAEPLAAARRRLVVEHPLQPFSIDAFDTAADPRLRSFNAEYCDALRRRQAGVAPPALAATASAEAEEADDSDAAGAAPAREPFFFAALAAPGAEWQAVSLDTLVRFLRNPCRFLLRERLEVDLADAAEALTDDEPFLPDAAGRRALAERLLPHCIAGADRAALAALAQAGTEYPAGRLGALALERELGLLAAFGEEVRRESAAACLPPWHATLDFDLAGEPWRLSGVFNDLRPGGLLRWRYADTGAADYLTGWISHLFLCAAPPAGAAAQTLWLSRNGRYRLRACAGAPALLREILHLYRRGLREPLHFFPKAAWHYAARDGSLARARKAWLSTREQPWGEEEDPAYRLALRGLADPLDDAFMQCATTVFGPLRDCLEDERL